MRTEVGLGQLNRKSGIEIWCTIHRNKHEFSGIRMTIQTRGMPMEQILEEFGEEFTITGKRLGWYIGQWKGNGGWTVMLKSIDKVDFVFCTLIPKTNGEFDPLSGVLEQTWYASLQGQIMDVCADGIKQLLETRKSRYDSIPKVEKDSEILMKNEDGAHPLNIP